MIPKYYLHFQSGPERDRKQQMPSSLRLLGQQHYYTQQPVQLPPS